MDPVPARLAAALAHRYRIDREIGAGGAATVYLADDVKHDRRVALKVLRPQVAEALGADRFEDEIRIAARLHHPHILAVHDSGEADGFLYYVMPYVEGHSLRERLQDGTRIPPAQVAKILAEVADALANAHDAGIVHRDIKPENIMLSGKHALVTDFGIAKAISDAGGRKSTTSMGLALGTPAYMAPEQAAADPNLDHRADIYALGVVGYEMLAGRPPFSGSAQEVLASHVTVAPEPVATLRPDLPPALGNVIMRALAKAPRDRWQTAEQMQQQLEPLAGATSSGFTPTIALPSPIRALSRRARWIAGLAVAAVLVGLAIGWTFWRGPAPGAATATTTANSAAAASDDGIPDLATDPSIAVLPFENMSSDKEQEYFSDGIAEELLNLLAKVPKLRVIARTSSFAYKDKDVGVAQIARDLKVATILEGSVRKSGDKVRITVQLIRARDGTHLWSETYDRTLEDVFQVQDEIARNVVEKLQVALLGGTTAPAARPVDPRVYPQVLRAQALINAGSKAARWSARSLLEDAAKVAPDEPRIWLLLGRVYLNQSLNLDADPKALRRLGRAAAERVLALDPGSGTAHTYLGRLAASENRPLQEAADHYARALALEPTNPQVLANASVLLSTLRPAEAIKVRRWLAANDPANPNMLANYCRVLYQGSKFQEAIRACEEATTLSPEAGLQSVLSSIYFELGDMDRALEWARKETDPLLVAALQARVYHATGRRQEAEAELAKVKGDPSYASEVAMYYAAVGEKDAAFEWIEKTYAADAATMVASVAIPDFRRLHGDPRWMAFLRRIGHDPETLSRVKFEMKVPD